MKRTIILASGQMPVAGFADDSPQRPQPAFFGTENMSSFIDWRSCRKMLEIFPIPVFIHQNGVFIYANFEAARLHGVKSASELMGKPLTNFIHPDDLPKLLQILSQSTVEPSSRREIEIRILRPDRKVLDVEVTSIPLTYEGKSARMAVCIDRTEHKREDMAREDNFQFLQTLLDTIPNPIFYKNTSGAYLGCNKKFSKKILGLAPEEIVGKTVFDLSDKIPKDLARIYHNHDQMLLSRPGVQVYEAKVSCSNSTLRDFLFYKATFSDIEGNISGLVGVMMDITELREAQLALYNYQKKLRELSSSMTLEEEEDRRRIATDLNEQIGQTLAVSKIKLGALKAAVPSAELMASLDEIRGLISQTIQATRLLTFQLSPPVLHEVGLRAALDWLVENFCEQCRIKIKFESQGNETLALDDKIRVLLFKATRELLFNVVTHSNARSAAVSLNIEDDTIHIRVKDDGVGFDLKRISSPSDDETGFGLFGIRERMSHLGGTLAIESAPGEGTQVTLTSPTKFGKK